MFRIFMCIAMCGMFSGCLNVNLKSVLPKEDYYSLDSIRLKEACQKIDSIYNLNVNVLSPYDGKDILIKDNLQIKILDTYKWIDLPKNMIRNAFIKTAANSCISIESTPGVGQKISSIRLNIIDLYLAQDSPNSAYSANIYATFEVIGYDLARLKSSAFLSNASDTNPIKALQLATQKLLDEITNSIKNSK